MNIFRMEGADPTRAITHLAFYGLADILVDGGLSGLRLRWSGDVPEIEADGLDATVVEDAVRAHADGRGWVAQTHAGRGTMSPRVTSPSTSEEWRSLQVARHGILDASVDQKKWADLRFLAALGEPGYWRFDRFARDLRPDEAASLWDMQPRNRGSELMASRLTPLRAKLLARKSGTVSSGLSGATVYDDVAGDDPAGITATGLAVPGPVDTAVAWCALWGIGQFPLGLRTSGRAVTAGILANRRRGSWRRAAYLPVWEGDITLSRLRSVLSSTQLSVLALAALNDDVDDAQRNVDSDSAATASSWLRDRGVVGAFVFPMKNFGSEKAQAWRALDGIAVDVTRTK